MPKTTPPSLSVLVVEDDQFLSDAYRAEFARRGYSTALAFNGNEALTRVKKSIPDLIILDLAMPDKNGVEVLQEWHRAGITDKTTVIVASNLDNPEVEAQCRSLGARDFFIKSNVTLSELIDRCVAKRG